MAHKSTEKDPYVQLTESIKANTLEQCYIFHGPERYLLERGIAELRASICPDGVSSFNYRRYEGDSFSVKEFKDAVNTFPMFAEKTLTEVHDFNIFAGSHAAEIRDILSDLPDFVCVVFSYDTLAYKPDKRLKDTKEILKHARVFEFVPQDGQKLVKWIIRHFESVGCTITPADAEHLAFITGGLMTNLVGEIEKVAAYSNFSSITKKDIDDVVTPTLDTISFNLTDALLARNHKKAFRLLDELFQMREAPHMLIASISKTMRRLLAARICLDHKVSQQDFMKMCSIYHNFQATKLLNAARQSTLEYCKKATQACAATAQELNSMREPESRLIELLTKLATV